VPVQAWPQAPCGVMPLYAQGPPPLPPSMGSFVHPIAAAQPHAADFFLGPLHSYGHIDDFGPPLDHAPVPPGWHEEEEERPHILSVDLEELDLRPEADHMKAGWFETLKYFLTLHPHSEEHDDIPLPKHAPKATIQGEFLVSEIHPPKEPEVGVKRVSFREGDGDVQSERVRQHTYVPFKEHLELKMDRLDAHLVAYLWGKKSSMRNEEFTLVGRAVAPLHDYQHQRKFTKWGVFDLTDGHRMAELRLKYSVITTPSAVQRPRAVEAEQTKVTLQWTPPASDHGSPLIGYRISILLDQQHNDGPQWHTVCELTKSSTPSFVVTNLVGNTAYLVDIQAVNKVGPGDACEVPITTAPCGPDPPSKPWVEESRDDCLNVAWYPPPSDGGFPVKTYRLKMRKILGASASTWNKWMGPKDSKAIWIDMGTVAASEKEQDEPSMYNAWVGPLEKTTCEYRFQVFALNKAGESEGSELSEPEYT